MKQELKIIAFPDCLMKMMIALAALVNENAETGVIIASVSGLFEYLKSVFNTDSDVTLQKLIDEHPAERFIIFRSISKLNEGYSLMLKETTDETLGQLFKLASGYQTGIEIIK